MERKKAEGATTRRPEAKGAGRRANEPSARLGQEAQALTSKDRVEPAEGTGRASSPSGPADETGGASPPSGPADETGGAASTAAPADEAPSSPRSWLSDSKPKAWMR